MGIKLLDNDAVCDSGKMYKYGCVVHECSCYVLGKKIAPDLEWSRALHVLEKSNFQTLFLNIFQTRHLTYLVLQCQAEG